MPWRQVELPIVLKIPVVLRGPCPLNRKTHQAIEGKLWVEMNGDKSSTLMQSYAVLLRSNRGQSRTPAAPQSPCPREAAP